MRRTSSMGLSFPPFTRAVKQLLIANGIIFLLVEVLDYSMRGSKDWIQHVFGLVPLFVVHGWIWQLVTYAFLHQGLFHILFNMLALWMFGAQLEQDWGYNLFMQFYFFCVVGAAICTVLISFTGSWESVLTHSPLEPRAVSTACCWRSECCTAIRK